MARDGFSSRFGVLAATVGSAVGLGASSKVLMPICGFLISLFIALRWGRTNFIEANSNHGKLHNQTLASTTFTVATRITPVLILVILLVGLWQ